MQPVVVQPVVVQSVLVLAVLVLHHSSYTTTGCIMPATLQQAIPQQLHNIRLHHVSYITTGCFFSGCGAFCDGSPCCSAECCGAARCCWVCYGSACCGGSLFLWQPVEEKPCNGVGCRGHDMVQPLVVLLDTNTGTGQMTNIKYLNTNIMDPPA